MSDVSLDVGDDHVATVEIHRPPHNYFDAELIGALADAYEAVEADPAARAIVLCAEGRSFCAGALLGPDRPPSTKDLYAEAVRLFAARTPVVAAVHGAAIGGGLGLALPADFRVGAPEVRCSANFARLGFHHGFGLTVTLPAVVGQQRALELLYTGMRIAGDEAQRIGLLDRLVLMSEVRAEAHGLAVEIAASAPLAVDSIRTTMRGDLAGRVQAATEREQTERHRLTRTADFAEGVAATAKRRTPRFEGR